MRKLHTVAGLAVAAMLALTGCLGVSGTGTEAQPPTAVPSRPPAVASTVPTPAAPSSVLPTVTVTATPRAPLSDPAAVVTAYYDAINRRDYGEAWRLGGKNFARSYRAFVEGFATTRHDELIVVETKGNTVHVLLLAEQTDGSVKTYEGTYTVSDGVLAAADMHAAPSLPHAICRDGTISYSVHRQGTCSQHGGVREWLRP